MTKIEKLFCAMVILFSIGCMCLTVQVIRLTTRVAALEELTATHTELHQVQSDINYGLLDWLENQ